MSFWHTSMPQGMYLRSACDCHLDPINIHTLEAYLQTQQLRPADVESLARDVYLDYAQWFQEQKMIEPQAKDVGERLTVDHIILATGYKVNMANIPSLRRGNILPSLQISNGYPILDEHFQSTIPGLFITSMPATQDFASFFAFTVSVRASAHIVGSFLKHFVAH